MLADRKRPQWNRYTGIVIAALLFGYVVWQIHEKVADPALFFAQPPGNPLWLAGGIVILFVNAYLESSKWRQLAGQVEPVSLAAAVRSYLAGLAASTVTPGSIGDYPARIVYLGARQPFRYAHVAALGILAQWATVYGFGLVALGFYLRTQLPGAAIFLVAPASLVVLLALTVYLRAEVWLARPHKWKWVAQLATQARLAQSVPRAVQWRVLAITIVRFLMLVLQFVLLLRWVGIAIPLSVGLPLIALFFGALNVLPSFSLAEPGIRGGVALYLFQPYGAGAVPLLLATTTLWLINIAFPALAGSLIISAGRSDIERNDK